MSNHKIINPQINDGICPHCGIYTQFEWGFLSKYISQDIKLLYHDEYNKRRICNFLYHHNNAITHCINCNKIIIFYEGTMVYPNNNLLLKPNNILDEYPKSKKLFMEAVEVAPISPRAGLTLSRMCLEALVNEILEINSQDISKVFKNNIDKLLELEIITPKIKNKLDTSRVIGNKATHNFNIIDTENDPNVDDCLIVLETINLILENIKNDKEYEERLIYLENKVKGNNLNSENNNK